ncbi:hypothetical protein [Methylobacterium sp. E-046]|uniref:hypothetical protein n=1 Tax=Methylobacterium sp. E-046 TaxID=2836576 RepID=UPI001FB9B05B|nr:hypothetical protein [Methylobacterium sp. E-046]MCJ2103169.1 hypothetical protein [Methylobacterium sp. E-046]
MQRSGRGLLADFAGVVSNLDGDGGGERHLTDGIDPGIDGDALAGGKTVHKIDANPTFDKVLRL